MQHSQEKTNNRKSSSMTKIMQIKQVEQNDHKKFGKLKWAVLHGKRGTIESLLGNDTPVDNLCTPEKDYRSPLHSSIYLGDPEIVRKLLDGGASVNVLNVNDETALILAAKFEKYDIVDLLLSDKRLKNCANRENFTHLHIACIRNRVDVVEKLLNHKADVNTAVKSNAIRWSGFTPLHFAVEFKSIEIVAFLLKAGADITTQDSKKLTALHLADMKRNVEMVDMILEAHKRVTKNPTNSEGLSHFHIACTRNDEGIVECFIKNGVTLNARVDKKSLNWPHFRALDFAIYYDCANVVELLLEESNRIMLPSFDEVDRIKNAYCTGNIELVNLLLQRDVIEKENSAKMKRPPELHCSCMYKDVMVVQSSLSIMPDLLNATMWQGSTPLHLAVERRDDRIVRYLIEQGADYSIKNFDGKTSLHSALEQNMKHLVNLFFSNLDRIIENPADNDGLSHFHIACIENEAKAIEHYIKLGVHVNAPVNNDSVFWPGFTPLHLAAKFGSANVVHTLLNHGSSYVSLNKDNMTAFDVALSEFRKINQDNAWEILKIMKSILSTHSKSKIETFNDRGFSLLHLLSTGPFDNVRGIIQEHHCEINKAVHTLGTPWDGYTPLHFAMLEEEPENARLLVERGADIWIKAADGNYPFHLAVDRYVTPGVSLNTSDFEKMQHNPVGSNGYSMFHVACAGGELEWMKYFLEHGVDPNMRTTLEGHEFHDKTAFHLILNSVVGSNLKSIQLLLEYGADIGIRDYLLETPLHRITSQADTEIIGLLINHGLDVNSRNACLETPLLSMCTFYSHYSDKELREKMVRLLDHGADINLEDDWNTTPLTIQVWKDNLEEYPLTIEVLIKHVMKLRAMGLYVKEENDRAANELSLLVLDGWESSCVEDYPVQCRKEIEAMKEVRINGFTSLHDVIFKDLNGLSVISENSEFQRIVSSDDLRKIYPIYGPMIELQLRRGQERRPLLSNAEKMLKFLMKMSVPRECTERILKFLPNEDLKSIIESSFPSRLNTDPQSFNDSLN